MNDHPGILIGAKGGDHVSLTRAGGDSKAWIAADIEVRCDVWTGRVRCSFHKGELSQFANEIRKLYRKLSGAAELKPLEPNIHLVLSGDGKGHVTVDGEARQDFLGAVLTFRFEIDQTFLNRIANELDKMENSN